MTIHAVIHILPYEIDQLELLLTHMKRCQLPQDEFLIDITLNCNLVDWNKSILDRKFFENKFINLEILTSSWAKTKFDINIDGSVMGCNDVRRNAIRNTTCDWIMYLDADNVFSDTFLRTVLLACDFPTVKDELSVIVPQTTRMWDTSWDIITNKNFITIPADHDHYNARDPYICSQRMHEEVTLHGMKEFKFAGWGTTINIKLARLIDIPDSLGHYGLDDTFISMGCYILKQKDDNLRRDNWLARPFYNPMQFIIENEVIIENNKFRFNPYKDYLVTIDKREEFLAQAHANFNPELEKFKSRI